MTAIVASQVTGGAFCGSKGGPGLPWFRDNPYDMRVRSPASEWLHQQLAWIAPPIAIVATAIGFVMANAPHWMAVTIACWAGFVTLFIVWHRAGWRVDANEAIRRSDPAVPGGPQRQIGIGICRYASRTPRGATEISQRHIKVAELWHTYGTWIPSVDRIEAAASRLAGTVMTLPGRSRPSILAPIIAACWSPFPGRTASGSWIAFRASSVLARDSMRSASCRTRRWTVPPKR